MWECVRSFVRLHTGASWIYSHPPSISFRRFDRRNTRGAQTVASIIHKVAVWWKTRWSSHLPKVLHGNNSCTVAVRRQEASSDGSPRRANWLVDPQHNLHAAFTENTWPRLNRAGTHRRAEHQVHAETHEQWERKQQIEVRAPTLSGTFHFSSSWDFEQSVFCCVIRE